MNQEETSDAPRGIDELCRLATTLATHMPGPLRSLRVRAGDLTVELEWPGTATTAPVPREAPPDQDVFHVPAPLVGTFYRGPSPEAAPFVEVGDMVSAGQQLGIVEAMKLMNAVEADRPGRVLEVLVKDGSPVEYGEALFALSQT